MKLVPVKFTLFVLVILSATAFCQQQGMTFNFYGGGARAEGMGYAFFAVSDDGSAGSWNPAGLYVHEKILMTFSYGFFAPRGQYTFKEGDPLSVTDDHTGSYGSLSFWNIITPLRVQGHHVVANISYTRNFDIYYEFTENLCGWWTGDDPNALLIKEGGVSSINFGLGTRIYEALSFGLSANIYTGKTVSEERRYFYKTAYDSYRQDFVDNELKITTLDSTTYSGFNVTLGLLYTTDKFRTGLVLRTPFNLRLESDSSIISEAFEIGTEGQRTPLPNKNVAGTIFATEIEYPYPKIAKIEIPLTLGLGAAYNIKDNWLVAADIEYKKFSNRKIHILESFSYTQSANLIEEYSDTVNVPNWSDVLQFRIGTEYLYESPIGTIPIRFGFRNEVLPQGNIYSYKVSDVEEDGYTEPSNVAKIYYSFEYDEDQIKGFSVSLGTGIYWSQILLDFAYSYTKYSQDIYENETAPRNKSTNEWKNHHINMTFTGYF